MSNSKLVNVTILSPNHSGKRNHVIDMVAIHCMAGNLSVESCGNMFASRAREASSNYGIGSDGRIGLYVDEANRSWCTSSGAVDHRAVTIEVANTAQGEPWPISDAAYKSLINLLVDICQRNGIKELLWKADKSLFGQVDKQNMAVHRWFANKSCPGNWLYEHHGQIAAEVNARLKGSTTAPAEPEKPGTGKKTVDELAREVIRGLWGSGSERKRRLTEAGYDYEAVQDRVNELMGKTKPTASSPTPKIAYAEKYDGGIAGAYKVKASDGLNMRTGPGTNYEIVQTIQKGTVVRNYGYYSARNGVKWLYVQVGKAVGFVHSGYLAKV